MTHTQSVRKPQAQKALFSGPCPTQPAKKTPIQVQLANLSLLNQPTQIHELQDGFQAKRVIKDWFSFYNTERPHTALDKQSPDDVFFDTERTLKAA